MNDLALNLRIRVNADGSAQVLNQTSQGFRDIYTSARQASRATDDTRRSFSQTALGALSMGDALRVAGAGFSIMGIAQYSKELIQTADTMTLMDSRIRIATTSQNDYVTASKGLLAVSLDTNTSLAANDQLFSRTNKAVEIMGGTVRDTVAMINTLDESLRISGATTSETESLTKQLSQAIASGVVRGDEFNSIMENGSRIAYALADGLHVNVGKLREMAEAGELSATTVIKAIMSQSDVIHAEFKKIPLTVGAAMQNIKTAYGQYVSAADSGSAATSTLAEHINGLAKNLTPVLDGIVTLGEVTATVIGGQMVISIGQYVAAQYSSIVASRASAAARMVELESAVALTSRNLALAQSQFSATSLVTGARIAETQATLAGNIAMGARMAIGNQLNLLLAEQAAAQATLTTAQAAATAATMAQTAATASFASGLKLLLSPINLVNVGLAGLVGWEVGKWLNSFETVRIVATASLGAIMQGIENVSYYWDRLKAVVSGNSDRLDGLKASHLAQKTAIDDNIVSTIKYEMSGRKAAETTVNQATALSTLTGQQDKATDAEKKAAKEAQKKSDAIAKGIADEIRAQDEQLKKLTMSERAYKEYELSALGMTGAVKASELAKWDLIKAAEAEKKGIEAGKSAMDAEKDRYNQLTLSAHNYFVEKLKAQGVAPGEIPAISALHDKNDGIEKQQKAIDDVRQKLESYNSTIDSTKDKLADLGSVSSSVFDGALGGISAMAGAFGNMVGSINENTLALDALHKRQAEVASFQPSLDKDQYLKDLKLKQDLTDKNAKKEAELTAQNTALSLAGVRQMTGASAAMFAENSKGRKVMHALEMTLGAVEMAMNIQGLAAKGAAAVLNQGAGDPYSAFARIAAMTAIVGGIIAMAGGAFSGGGGSSPPPVTSDSGTVLGDKSAKSQSVDKTYQLLKDIHASEYAELRGINQGIASLNSGITNTITRLFQGGGIVDPQIDTSSKLSTIAKIAQGVTTAGTAAFAIFAAPWTMGLSLLAPMVLKYVPIIGDIISGISNFIFGGLFGKVTKSVVGGGIVTGATPISSVMAGGDLSASQYATIETKKKSWFSSSTSYSEIYAAVNGDVQTALNQVFKSMGGTMLSLAGALGNDLTDRVNNYVIPAMRIELRGLSSEDASKKLNGVISATLDSMASTVFSDIVGQYQQLGEGMLETTVRIVSEIAIIKDAFHATSTTMGTDVIAISDAIVQASGGLKEFQKQFDSYIDKFFTDKEKFTRISEQAATELLTVFTGGVIDNKLAKSRDMYREVLSAIDTNTAAGQKQFAVLISLSDQADQYYNHIEDLAKQQRNLDIQIMEAQGNAVAALAEKRRDELAAMDETLRLSQSIVYAYQDVNDKIKSATGGLTASMSTMKTLADGIKTALASTVIESDALTRQKRESAQLLIKNAANSGAAVDSIPGLADALKDIAKPSSQLFKTSIDYARDQGRTAANLEKLYSNATAQLSDAQKQLDAVNGTTSAVLTVAEAVRNLQTALLEKQNVVPLVTAQSSVESLLSAKNAAWTNYAAATAALSIATQDRLNYVGTPGSSSSSDAYMTKSQAIYEAMATVTAKGKLFDAAVSALTIAQNKVATLKPAVDPAITTGGGALIDDGALAAINKQAAKDAADRNNLNALNALTDSYLSVSNLLATVSTDITAEKDAAVSMNMVSRLLVRSMSQMVPTVESTEAYWLSLSGATSDVVDKLVGEKNSIVATMNHVIGSSWGMINALDAVDNKISGNKDAVMPTLGHLIGSAWGMSSAMDDVDNKLSSNKDAVMPTLGHLIGSAWGMSSAMDDMSKSLTGAGGAVSAINGVRDSSAALIKTMQESNSALSAQLQALQQEVARLRSATEATATNTRKTSDVLVNVTRGGNEMVTTAA